MDDHISSVFAAIPLTYTLASGVAGLIYLGYCWALPRPIPGIPYNKEATKSLLGDIRPMMKDVEESKEIYRWISNQTIKLKSPIVQLFVRPFAKPWVVIADFQESQDIMLRRTKEFDRTDFVRKVFEGVMPENHFTMKTNEVFKLHREWLKDLMTPDFLYTVVAPQINTSFTNLIQLWRERSKLAQGHPFIAPDDIYRASLDMMLASLFGPDPNSSVRGQLQLCSSIKDFPLPSDVDEPVTFPAAPDPATSEAILYLVRSMETSMQSPFPSLAHWFLRQKPSMRNAKAIKDQYIKEAVEKAERRIKGESSDDASTLKYGLDTILNREIRLAEKEGRAPVLHSRAIYDEIFGLIVAGHDSIANTLSWAVKYMADHADVQDKLRSEIRSALADAAAEKRDPTIDEITKTNIPYLDATIEEILRRSFTVPSVNRVALNDTVVLGHHIPKGTELFFIGNGPSAISPAYEIADSLRSASYRAATERVGSWDPKDMGQFRPERWLVKKDGKTVFNANAGPLLVFGIGARGCYGKRMAYLELRMSLVEIIWNFELQKCPEELSGHESVDRTVHAPQQCYVRLKSAR